jgi:hypothetical protein
MNKIDALRGLADKLRDPSTYYYWNHASTCNCGLLAQVTSGVTEKELLDNPYIKRTWNSVLNCYDAALCRITNIRLAVIVESLLNTGFTHDEIRGLEYINHCKIINYMKSRHMPYQPSKENRWAALSYVEAWIEYEEEQAVQQLSSSLVKVKPKQMVGVGCGIN